MTMRRPAGFTLIEIVIVLAVLTLLAGTAVPMIGKTASRGRIAETRAELSALPQAVSAYFQDTGLLPPTFDDLQQNVSGAAAWAGPYLVAILSANASTTTSLSLDAWNRSYTVSVSGPSTLTVASLGPDGVSSADDLVQLVDVTPVRRAQTLDELRSINGAIQAWNAVNLPANPLPPDYPALLAMLVGGGYLPAGTSAWDADGWGSAYVPDPPSASPVAMVDSPNL